MVPESASGQTIPTNRVCCSDLAAAKLRSWRVWVPRQRAQPLGYCRVPDERAAEAAAQQFGLTHEQRQRLGP
jgi:hypothetical protein